MKMILRTVAAALAALIIALPAEAQDRITRITGKVTAENYRVLAAFLQERFDQVVALSLSFPASDGHAEGELSAYMEGDLFVAYVPGPGNDTQISASNGFIDGVDRYVFDRFYKVSYGGMGQGIVSIFIEPTMPSSAPVDTIDIVDLKVPG